MDRDLVPHETLCEQQVTEKGSVPSDLDILVDWIVVQKYLKPYNGQRKWFCSAQNLEFEN